MLELNKEGLSGMLDMLKTCNGLKIISQSGNTNFDPIVANHGNEIEISYKTGPGQFISSPFRISRFIPLDKRTFQAFGLMQAECAKKLTYASFCFSNTASCVVRFILDYFEDAWKIPRKSWKVGVQYWRGEINEGEKKKITEFWATRLSAGVDQIKVWVGTPERFSKSASQFGTAAIRLDNRIAQVLVMRVLEMLKTMAENDENAAGAYLCGLLAGDGTVLEYKGNLTAVGLCFNPHSTELDHYVKVLARVGVNVEKEKLSGNGKKVMYFTHWRNVIALLKASNGELFLPHRKNAVRFYKGFLANQYVEPFIRLRLFNGRRLTAKEFARLVCVCKRTANLDLNRLVALGFLQRDGKGTTSSPFQFYLTEEGKVFLEIVEKIEEYLRRELRWGGFDVQ